MSTSLACCAARGHLRHKVSCETLSRTLYYVPLYSSEPVGSETEVNLWARDDPGEIRGTGPSGLSLHSVPSTALWSRCLSAASERDCLPLIHSLHRTWAESIPGKLLLLARAAVRPPSAPSQYAIYRSPSGPNHSLGAAWPSSMVVEANPPPACFHACA